MKLFILVQIRNYLPGNIAYRYFKIYNISTKSTPVSTLIITGMYFLKKNNFYMFISLTFYDSTNEFIIMSDYDVVVYIEIPHL